MTLPKILRPGHFQELRPLRFKVGCQLVFIGLVGEPAEVAKGTGGAFGGFADDPGQKVP